MHVGQHMAELGTRELGRKHGITPNVLPNVAEGGLESGFATFAKLRFMQSQVFCKIPAVCWKCAMVVPSGLVNKITSNTWESSLSHR